MDYIVGLANKIGKLHSRFFLFLSRKAEEHPAWAVLLTIVALYEIFEHIALPLIAILWSTGTIGMQ